MAHQNVDYENEKYVQNLQFCVLSICISTYTCQPYTGIPFNKQKLNQTARRSVCMQAKIALVHTR